jgi:RNase H-like domain found in reverse transcriptase
MVVSTVIEEALHCYRNWSPPSMALAPTICRKYRGKPGSMRHRWRNRCRWRAGTQFSLRIIWPLNEYRTMLYGCRELHVHTDHKNLTFNNLHTQRVLRWRLFIEEFGPQFHYVKGSDNPIADALSRLSFSERQNSNHNMHCQQRLLAPDTHVYCHRSTPGGFITKQHGSMVSSSPRALWGFSPSRHPQDAFLSPSITTCL